MAGRLDRVTAGIWRSLCVATAVSGLVSFLWLPQGLWLAVLVAPGLLVALLLLVAGYADWRCGRG